MTALSRRSLLLATGAAALTLPLRWANAAPWKGYNDAIVIDGLGGPGSLTMQPGEKLSEAHLKDVRDSGLTAVLITLGPVGTTPPDAAFKDLVRGLIDVDRDIERHPDTFARIRTAADITAAKKAKRTGLIYGVQDGVAFETDLELLEDLYQLGLRVVQPTYNRRNLIGDGCMEPANAGLSRTGVETIERLNSLGILVDLSHCGRQTSADAIRVSKKPVAFTHTGAAAVVDHPRHRTDAELRAVADKGGVSGVFFMPYLTGGKQPTAADIIRHLDHMINVAGEDHVSLGTDGTISPAVLDQKYKDAFAADTRNRKAKGIAAPGETEDGYLFANDLNTPRRFETLSQMLADRGYSATRIEKILGRNLLRVFGDAWGS
ncbi:dipeptidase [Peristeroidobacter soli]|uniref:dipeptidase n=1 Tax=Peristeroidobacter soli TaxID=2497877 RepID=UPI00101BA249|nr:membrane dipeptidase [Peristeroidobacter soli]